MDGYRHVPKLAFTATELMALVFSRDLLKPLQGTQLKASLDSALNKAEATLPNDQTIDQIMRAIAQTQTIQIRYYSASLDRVTRRRHCRASERQATARGIQKGQAADL